MGVSIFYSGKLAEGKTIDNLVYHIEKTAKDRSLKSQRPEESSNKAKFRFQIPQQVIDNPDDTHGKYPNRWKVLIYAQEARLPFEKMSYIKLCNVLNSTEFTQRGVYLWVHQKAEPLRFIFVNDDAELTELKLNSLQGNSLAKPIQYVSFNRDSLATKTGYERDPQIHKETLDILKNINHQFFGGNMRIKEPE